jgi:hypothetical protein
MTLAPFRFRKIGVIKTWRNNRPSDQTRVNTLKPIPAFELLQPMTANDTEKKQPPCRLSGRDIADA